mgnify:CR=1 FL=1
MTTATLYDLVPANESDFKLTVTQVPDEQRLDFAALWRYPAVDNAGTPHFRLDGPLLCGLQRWYLVLLHAQQWRRVYGSRC